MARRKRDLQKIHLVERDLKTRIDELTALYEVSKSITSSIDLDKILSLIVRKVAHIMKADICMIHLLDKKGLELKVAHSPKNNNLKPKRFIPLKDNVIERAIKTKVPLRIDDLSGYPKGRFCAVAKKEKPHSVLVVPLIEKDKVIGTLTCCFEGKHPYTKDDENEMSLFASQAAVAVENARLFDEIKTNYLNTMKLLASVIDAKDTYTEDHSKSVTCSAIAIADIMGLSKTKKFIIRYASMLHDIGKIGIDIGVLRKPGALTKNEWAKMKRHPRIGVDIIKKAGFLDDLLPAILYHHVRYEGGGYPQTKKKKNKIPIEARILAVADAYGAMRSNRPYRKGLSKEEAIRELRRCSGAQFDPSVIRAFLKYLNKK